MVLISNTIVSCTVLSPSFEAFISYWEKREIYEIFKQFHLAFVKTDRNTLS